MILRELNSPADIVAIAMARRFYSGPEGDAMTKVIQFPRPKRQSNILDYGSQVPHVAGSPMKPTVSHAHSREEVPA